MVEFSKLTPAELIASDGFKCDCGAIHATTGLKIIKMGRGVSSEVGKVLGELGLSRPFVVTDKNEYEAAGKKVIQILDEQGIPYVLHIIPCAEGKRIAPSEFAVGSIALNFDTTCDCFLCVGSGVMNDLCKVLSSITGKPSVVVATAPSMDGYASDSSAMEVNNLKLSLKEVIPAALICDVDIMANAPMHMLHAGLGDMMGKFSALSEWRIVKLLFNEHYCAETAALVHTSLDKIVNASRGVPSRDIEAIEAISEGLILSGIAMAFVGHSRPASGLDHYFSHCWEMMALARGEESDLHGIQVGVGTILTLKLYEHLLTITPTMERAIAAADAFDQSAWEANVRRVFGDTAEDILARAKAENKNDRAARLARAEKIISNWDAIKVIAKETPSSAEIESIMRGAGMPITYTDIGVSKQDVIDAFICSRDVRAKYQLSTLLWDIGYMDEFAAWLEGEI